MSYQCVLFERREGIARLTLNRPERLNSFNLQMHEEVRRAPISELARSAAELETRGEFVLVIGPPAAGAQIMAKDQLDDLLRRQLADHSVKDAVAHAVELSGRPRREIYARALELAGEADAKGEDDQI